MTTISADNLAAELAQVLDAVMAGHEIIITREGKPVARIVSAKPSIQPGFGGAAGCIRIHDDFDKPLPDFDGYMPRDT